MKLLTLPLGILIALCCIEAPLQLRHHLLGYDTPVISPLISLFSASDVSADFAGDANRVYGPTEDFPFRSRLPESRGHSEGLIWVASASHAEHIHFPVETVFPNRICEFYKGGSCFVVNGSHAGIGITQNLQLLDAYTDDYMPRYALLYQQSLQIGAYQKEVATEGSSSATGAGLTFQASSARAFMQKTSLYQHLSDYLGGNIKLHGQLKDKLPEAYIERYRDEVLGFIQWCQQRNIEPILATFATSYTSSNIDEIPQNHKTNFVRYSVYLSPLGWSKTIERFNLVIKELAKENDLALIDLNENMSGKGWLFVDFDHFSAEGHEMVAKFVADGIEAIEREAQE